MRSVVSRPPLPRSICWWTSRQNSRPEKVPGMPAGPRCSTSSRWLRSSTIYPNMDCWTMLIWKQKRQRQRPAITCCQTRLRLPRSAWLRSPCCTPTSMIRLKDTDLYIAISSDKDNSPIILSGLEDSDRQTWTLIEQYPPY